MSAPKPTVIFLNRFFYPDHSSTAQLLTDLTVDLARRGHKISIVTSRLQYDDPSVRLAAYEEFEGINVYRVATTGFGRSTLTGRAMDLACFYVTAFLALLKIARAGDVIVAKTDPPLLSILAQTASFLKGGRVINWLQDVYPEVAGALGVGALGGTVGRLIVRARNASLRAAQVNVVLGERMETHFRQANINADKIRIIPNWSDEQAIVPVPHEQNDLRVQWGLVGKFVVGYSGNLGRAHECDTMLAAANILQDDPNIAFLMIGGGYHTSALRAKAEREGVTNIVFRPYQPLHALAASLSAADLHWISLKPELEGLIVPSKVYGILAAGRPVLAVTDADGEIARLVERHGCGAQVAIGDHRGFAQYVRDLAADPARADQLGQAARRAATQSFARATALASWRQTVSQPA